MRILIISILIWCSCTSLSAQDLDSFKRRLEQPTLTSRGESVKVTINEEQAAALALERIEQQKRSTTVMGYRIGIFFDNGQDARNKAIEARDTFSASFPNEPIFMVYESPYYKVSAGNCLSEEEAIILFERIRPLFPNAYVMREKMNISDFIIEPVEMVDSAALQTAINEKVIKIE